MNYGNSDFYEHHQRYIYEICHIYISKRNTLRLARLKYVDIPDQSRWQNLFNGIDLLVYLPIHWEIPATEMLLGESSIILGIA